VNEGEEQAEHTAEMLGDLRGQIRKIVDVANDLVKQKAGKNIP